jgi:hypothetical protein
MVPFTKASKVSVSNQGVFQGGSTEFKKVDKYCKQVYINKATAITNIQDQKQLKVWVSCCLISCNSPARCNRLLSCASFFGPFYDT